MKRIILFVFVLMTTAFQINAQSAVTLNINHKLGDAAFAMNQAAKNNMDHDFNVNRLEYYISEISLVHDGGLESHIEDLWILVNAANKTQVDLGTYDISSIEKIKMHIGVNSDNNHLDPSSYSSDHPLAPKSPSMHWGWSAGYRFIAIEGYGGSSFNQLFELHGLGDNNYFTTEIDLNLTAENNQLPISLDADYTKAMENISVNSGVIVHGDNLEAKECIENFRDYVFSQSSGQSSILDFSEVKNFNVYPNPVINELTTIALDITNNNYSYDLSVTSLDGKQLEYKRAIRDGQVIDVSSYPEGIYFANLIKEGQIIISNKLIIK